jgi:hypothetical protein
MLLLMLLLLLLLLPGWSDGGPIRLVSTGVGEAHAQARAGAVLQ